MAFKNIVLLGRRRKSNTELFDPKLPLIVQLLLYQRKAVADYGCGSRRDSQRRGHLMTMLLGDCELAECNDSICLACERVAIDAVFLPFIDLIASLTFTRRELV